MNSGNDQPLGSLTEEAYELLLEAVEPDGGISVAEAQDHLREAGLNSEDAEYALDRLLNRGYLYKVEDQLRITDREID